MILKTIDLFQGYWLIKMEETYREKTNFICRYGTSQFEVMPMSLMNSGAMMDNVLANASNAKCYIDDVIIHCATEEEHVVHLETVMKLLRKNILRLRLKKCHSLKKCHFIHATQGDYWVTTSTRTACTQMR